MKQTTPLVSIVTPTYNSVRYLEDLLRSVESQEYPEIEHIVIDDGSSDNGATIALLNRHPRLRWWSRSNRGQYATLNEGFRAATGEFITTISADDFYTDAGAVGALARVLAEHKDCDVVHGPTLHLDQNGKPLPVQPFQSYPYWMLPYNLGFIFHCSLLVRRENLIRDQLFFDESLRYTGDGDWMARMYLKNYKFERIDRYVAAYRHHADQVSSIATKNQDQYAFRRAERKTVDQKYGRNLILRNVSNAYCNFQQKRVKVLGAWHQGGIMRLWNVTYEWLRKKA